MVGPPGANEQDRVTPPIRRTTPTSTASADDHVPHGQRRPRRLHTAAAPRRGGAPAGRRPDPVRGRGSRAPSSQRGAPGAAGPRPTWSRTSIGTAERFRLPGSQQSRRPDAGPRAADQSRRRPEMTTSGNGSTAAERRREAPDRNLAMELVRVTEAGGDGRRALGRPRRQERRRRRRGRRHAPAHRHRVDARRGRDRRGREGRRADAVQRRGGRQRRGRRTATSPSTRSTAPR